MTSDRSYRPGMSPDAALGELRRGAATQFDLHLVQVFIAVLEQRTDADRHVAAEIVG